MIKDIEKIESQSGMVEPSGTIGALPLLRLRASKIRPEVHRESRGTDILNCGGVVLADRRCDSIAIRPCENIPNLRHGGDCRF